MSGVPPLDADADDPDPSIPVAPSQASALVSSFTSFLTVALHSLLFHRRLYPPETFLVARAYSLPVRQSRHPAVCAWVRDAIAAVGLQIRAAAAHRVAFAVHAPATASASGNDSGGGWGSSAVVERWVFDLSSFPSDPRLATAVADSFDFQPADGDVADPLRVNWTDVHEGLRAALRKLAYTADSLPPPPAESTFTLAVELRDDAPAPIQHPQLWVPSEPHLQPPTPSNPVLRGSALGGASTVPVRSVQAGPLFFECWVEQCKPRAPVSTAADHADHDDDGDALFPTAATDAD